MKSWAWAAVGLVAGIGMVGGSAAGCGGDSNGSGGSGTGGTGGSTQSTATSNPTQSTGPTTGTQSTGTSMGDCGTALFMTGGCEDCVAASCCAEQKACDMGTDCFSLLSCEINGGTAADCEGMFPAGKDPLATLDMCVTTSCSAATACAITCTGNHLDTGNDDCNTCLGTNCCDQFTALTTDFEASSDPNCMAGGMFGECPPIAALTACEIDPTSAGCTADPVSKKAAACEGSKCGDKCPTPICDSGIVESGSAGAAACAQCLGKASNCCTEFEASHCSDADASMAGSACQVFLADLGMCAGDATCNGDANAAAANDCQNAKCMTECGSSSGTGGSGGGT